MRLSRVILLVLACCLSATAGNFSFTGTFQQDDQLEVFLFTAPSVSVVVRTWSYAGGTNANSQLIASGGFDPILSVFDATGGLIGTSLLVDSNNDGAGVATDPSTGNAFDSLLLLSALNPGGTYALVLSQNDNSANGPTYGDGFNRAGQGNFTPSISAFPCGFTGVSFCDVSGSQRTGNWAVDITGVGSALDTTAPEPGSIGFLATGIASLALIGRRRKQVKA